MEAFHPRSRDASPSRAAPPDRPPPRVLVNLTPFDALASGARERALGIAGALLRLGAEVTVAEAAGADLAALVPLPHPGAPLRVVRTPLDPLRPVHRAVRSGPVLGRVLREERPDAFLTDFYPVPRVPGTATVVTVHDLRDLRPVGGRPVRRAYFRTVYGRRLRRAGLVVTPSRFTRDEVVDRLGLDSARVAVIPNAVPDSLRARPDPAAAALVRERLDLPRRPYLLALGVLEPRKNLARLLDALVLLHREGEEVPALVVAGRGGPEEEPLRARAGDLPPGAIHWAGYVRPADLPSVYAGARALVHPATYEGYGMPVVEAMAQGIPVACADAAALPETAGAAALLFDGSDTAAVANAVLRVSRDDDLRRALAARGAARAADLTFDASARLLLDALGLAAPAGG